MTAAPDAILVSRGPGETRTALMAGDVMVEVAHRRDSEPQAGAVVFARIGAQVPSMPAVFVDLGCPGVLKVKPPLPNEGGGVAVRIVVPPRAGKGAEVKSAPDTAAPADGRPGQVLVSAPDPAHVWWRAYGAPVICGTPAEAARLAKLLGPQAEISVHRGGDLFTDLGAEEGIEAALERRVALPGGGALLIDATAALIALDVDAGPMAPEAANHEAITVAARELRRRNLAGHMVMDVIPARKRPAHLSKLLAELTAGDPAPVHVAGLTPLGMIEFTRERRGLSLAETLLAADGQLSAASAAYRLLRAAVRFGFTEKAAAVAVDCAPDVAAVLEGALTAAKAEAEQALKGPLTLNPRAGLARAAFTPRPA